MADMETEVMCVLLKTLFDQGLITKSIYDSAQNMVHSASDLPEFFEHGAYREKGMADGST